MEEAVCYIKMDKDIKVNSNKVTNTEKENIII